MQFIPLSDGVYTIDGTKELIPFEHEKNDLGNARSSLIIKIQPFLVRTNEHIILLDTGIGDQYSGAKGNLQKNLAKHGISRSDITMILISHLHTDHIGGLFSNDADSFKIQFPNAHIYVQNAELDYALEKGAPSYNTQLIKMLRSHRNTIKLSGNGIIDENIHYEVTGGHTPFHQVFIIIQKDEILFFGGDLVPVPEQLMTKYIAKYDYDGRLSAEKRLEYGKKGASRGWTFLFYHAKKIVSAKVEMRNGALKILQEDHF